MVTEKSTKKEILEAYHEKLEELKNLSVGSTAKDIKNDLIMETVADIVQKDRSEELEKFVSQFQELAENYRELEKAIEIKKAELLKISGIETKFNTYEALSLAINELEREKIKKEKELTLFYDSEMEKMKKELIKIKEEEKYKFQIEMRDKRDAEEYDLKIMVLEFEDRKRKEEKELEERFLDVNKREEKADELQERIAELENELENVKENIEDDIKDSLEGKFNKELKYEKANLQNRIDNLIEVLNVKDNTISDLKRNITDLQQQIKEAYYKIESLAAKTVDDTKSKEMITKLSDVLNTKFSENKLK